MKKEEIKACLERCAFPIRTFQSVAAKRSKIRERMEEVHRNMLALPRESEPGKWLYENEDFLDRSVPSSIGKDL